MPIKDTEQRRAYHRRYMSEWYQKNKKKHIASVARVHKKYQQWWRDYRATLSCVRCGENHPAIIDFHHSDPKQKEFNIGDGISNHYSKERIMTEVAKCDVLCANCYRKIHWEGDSQSE